MKVRGELHHEVNETSFTETTRAQKVALRIMINELLTRIDNILFDEAFSRLKSYVKVIKHIKDDYVYYDYERRILKTLKELGKIVERGRITSIEKLEKLLKTVHEVDKIMKSRGN